MTSGKVFQIIDVDTPIPKDNGVLLKRCPQIASYLFA